MTHDGKLEATYNIPSVGHNINSTFTSNVKSITYNNSNHRYKRDKNNIVQLKNCHDV